MHEQTKMLPRVAVCLAPGSEEMEAINTIAILKRAGFEVVVASSAEDGELILDGSRGIKLVADTPLIAIADEQFDCVVLPGGLKGAEHFRDSPLVIEFVKQHHYDGKLIAAICATPAVMFIPNELFSQSLMTCHPAFQSQIPEKQLRVKRVVYDKNHRLLTSQGPGTAQEFALEIVTQLENKAKASEVADPMVVWPNMHYDVLPRT
ncbi:DJ-1 family glyoxalase III [Photobacterium leiognathi]|uniref:DJ-1 family glyoxalase III n=1 Tax=Photobacterium leiognathi TaxID=553611 RepID=UPI0029825252|nr:DJ-1 family glyoxalase III [Photobacterium leiognathi]